MSTLAVVEAILREAAMPLSVREIVERAGDALPTKSKTPDTVVARDLSMDIKKRGEGSTFTRTSPGRYAIREQVAARTAASPGKTDERVDGVAAQPPAPVAPGPQASQGMTSAVSPGQQATTTVGGVPASPSPSIADSSVGAPTALVGQSLPHDRNGTRPAPGKTPSKPQNSEDTPMSA